MFFSLLWAFLALASLSLVVWQFWAAARFPLHQRGPQSVVWTRQSATDAPPGGITLLKPLKGADAHTADCLRSWLTQDFPQPVQILLGVASGDDPVCPLVRQLLVDHPQSDAELVICPERLGANAKVSTLIQLERRARHPVLAISDADVRVPRDFLVQALASLRDPEVGLVHSFYRLANPSTLAMRWEAVAINADFWSQVLQAATLRPVQFALGAAMVLRRDVLDEIGSFTALAGYLADDYQLGRRIARTGRRLVFCPLVAECWSPPMTWTDVWRHQLRWARTIRVCQPVPYFLSLLSNGTLWPLAWVLAAPSATAWTVAGACWAFRVWSAGASQECLTRSRDHWPYAWLVPVKDLLAVPIWALAFLGTRIDWRGTRYRLAKDGRLNSNP